MTQCSSGLHSSASMAALVGGSFTDVQEWSSQRRMQGTGGSFLMFFLDSLTHGRWD